MKEKFQYGLNVDIPEIPAVNTGMAFKNVIGITVLFKSALQLQIVFPEIIFCAADLDDTGLDSFTGGFVEGGKEIIPSGNDLFRGLQMQNLF